MPTDLHTFDVDGPLALQLTNARGTVVVVADSPGAASVSVSSRADDVCHVELADEGRRLVVEVENRRLGQTPQVDLVVHVPPGTSMRLTTASAETQVQGAVGNANVSTASGAITVDRVEGYLELRSASGSARVGQVKGELRFRSASGSLRAEGVGGACEARTASGSLSLGTADSDVTAKSVSGNVELREARSGTIDLRSTSGSIEVGVRRGALVWLDVASTTGRVESRLDSDPVPVDGEHPVTIRAKSVSGSIGISPAGVLT